MEKSLSDAALNNDVSTLIHLLTQDPHLLDRTSFKCEDKNPLHIAVMKENVGFVQEILKHKGSFCMCLARDRDGRNPLHLAAMYGKLNVLLLLIERAFPAALEKADGGGTILHLCVKYNQLEALKFLTARLKDRHVQNAKNEDGMTILHLAIYYNHQQITHYLLVQSRVEAEVKNADGETALDLWYRRRTEMGSGRHREWEARQREWEAREREWRQREREQRVWEARTREWEQREWEARQREWEARQRE